MEVPEVVEVEGAPVVGSDIHIYIYMDVYMDIYIYIYIYILCMYISG